MKFVSTTTEDGVILQGLLAEPTTTTNEVILHIHGMAGNFYENSFIKQMIEDYPSKNISFLTVETRGSELMRWFFTPEGRPRLLGNAYELFEECIYDIDAWITLLKEQGYTHIHLQGHSLGCSKIAYYQKEQQNPFVKSLSFISPSDMIGLLLNKRDRPTHEKYLAEAKMLVSQGKENELLSGIIWDFARLSAKTYLNGSDGNKNLAIFNYYNPELGFETINSITIPMLSILGTEDDGIVTNAYESTKMLEENATQCPKFRGEVFEGAHHSFRGYEKRITTTVLEFIH